MLVWGLLNVQEEDIYDAPEEYKILLYIRMQFKILIALYSYKPQKFEGYEKEYISRIWYVVDSKMRFN